MKKAVITQETLDSKYNDEIYASEDGQTAMQLFSLGSEEKLLDAVRPLNRFIDKHPDNMLARALRCEFRLINDYQLDKVVTESRLILEREPARSRMQFVLGRALVRLNLWAEAVAPLENFLNSNPKHIPTILMLALSYSAGYEDHAKGLRLARRAIKLAPEDDRTYQVVLTILKDKGDDEAAKRFAFKLMDTKPHIVNKLLLWSGGEAAKLVTLGGKKEDPMEGSYEELTKFLM